MGANRMAEMNKGEDRSTWAIGGGVLIGLGAGFRERLVGRRGKADVFPDT